MAIVLNEQQDEAVKVSEGPIMILAGAGSGKTRTLVSKINYLLTEKKLSPHKLLAVTFSNKAAREMRERVAQQSPVSYGALNITTFHSFCAQVLRKEAQHLGLSRNFTIYDDSESKTIIKSLLSKRGISHKETSPAAVRSFIDDLKNGGYYIGVDKKDHDFDIDQQDLYFQLFSEYEAELHRSNALDFGGLITGVLQLFRTYPKVLDYYQKRYQYLLVDEYQDTNRSQFNLLRLLSEHHRNICVVGDEDQSIYSWRGADIRNILEFEQVFPEVKVIKLEENYRSSKTIIEAARHLISNNVQRKGKNIWTSNDDGDTISIIEAVNDKAEAEYVVSEIQSLQESGVSVDDMAIFYRNNSQSRLIEETLIGAQIPYRIVGGIKFYERKEIKDMLAYIRLVVNPQDSLAMSRIINVPTRGIGATTLRKLENESVQHQVSLWETVENIVNNPEDYSHIRLTGRVKNSLRAFYNLIVEVRAMEENKQKPSESYEKLLQDSGYLEQLQADKNYESLSRIENLEELLSGIKQFELSNSEVSLLNFLETVTLDTEVTEDEAIKAQLSLMTVHGSKGLEYPYVYLIGAEENIFPSFLSLEDGENALEEERRLFYVAMTRAMQKLTISFAQARMMWGSLKFNGPSRFLDEIPEDFRDWIFYKTHKNSKSESFDDFSQENSFSEESVYIQEHYSRFPVGTPIEHKLYGKGKVIDTQGIGDEEKVLIKFRDGAKKRFMVKFAPLEACEERR
jgi:DNA helicase-2/ATP-dependent DNA helicase PcrA